MTKQLIITIDNAFDLKRIEKLACNAVVDTVRRFNRLERMAIVLVVDGEEYQPRKLVYVALSRGRAYLSVINSKKDQMWLKGEIAE